MFGLNDNSNNANPNSDVGGENTAGSMPPLSTTLATDSTPNSIDTAPPAPVATPPAPTAAPPAPAAAGAIGDVNLENAYIATNPPKASASQPSSPSTPVSQPTTASLVQSTNGDDLLKIKEQALQSLAPLVDHLEQSSEEKFRTTMMLIQASDNSDLIPEAYEAASKIEDEKQRAQALLDVVNEINYFTHQHTATQ